METSPFAKTMLKAALSEKTPAFDASSRVALTHGTSATQFAFSLSEGGKPAMSSALATIPFAKNDLEKTAINDSFTKFGQVVVAMSPEIIFKNKMSIYTRDSYTRDAPQKVLTRLNSKAAQNLSDKLKPYSEIFETDLVRNIRYDFIDYSAGGGGNLYAKLDRLSSKFYTDPAYQLMFYKERGLDIEIPYVSTYKSDELSEYLIDNVPRDLLDAERIDNLSEQDAEVLIGFFDSYYQQKAESANTKFIARMSERRIGWDHEEKVEEITDKLSSYLEHVRNPQEKVDTHALQTHLRELSSDHAELFYAHVLKTISEIGDNFVYEIDEEIVETKEESWEYIIENSEAHSQQSLTYSINEIFSLKAEELTPDSVFDRLGMIEPLKFSIGSDSTDCGYQSHLPMVSEFGKKLDGIGELLKVSGLRSFVAKRNIMDVCTDVSGRAGIDTLGDTVTQHLTAEGREQLSLALEDIQEHFSKLTGEELEHVEFMRRYNDVRDIKDTLNGLLDIPEMTFQEGRDFYKQTLPQLLTTNHYGGEDLFLERLEFGDADYLSERKDEICVAADALAEAFEKIPEEVPYFELVANYVLKLDSSDVHSIHVPQGLEEFIEELSLEHGFLKDKVTFYDPTVNDGLTSSLINSGATLRAKELDPDNRLHLKKSDDRNMKIRM